MKKQNSRSSEVIKNKKEHTIERVFRPGVKVDIVFEIDSISPIVRSANLHECRYRTNEMVVSQTQPQILPSYKSKRMDITVLIQDELNERRRFGVPCNMLKFIKDYQLSNSVKEDSIVVKYRLPIEEVNIRSAFRLEPSTKLEIGGKINFQGNTYHAGVDYKVHNISNTGIGLIIPKHAEKKRKSLLQRMRIDEKAMIELDLLDFSREPGRVIISAMIMIVRKNIDFNKKSGIIGLKFSEVNREDERILGKFIHEAQLYERRMLSRMP